MNSPDLHLKLTGFCKKCDESGCLEWIGGFGGQSKTTPIFHFPGTRLWRRSMPAYKAAWLLDGRALKKGQNVYRKCLNHKCVNPEHCAAGTPREMWAFIAKTDKHKGKANRKIANLSNGAKQRTSVEVVRQVEQLLAAKTKRKDIAVLTGVNVSTVTDIGHGRHFYSASRQQLIRGASVFALA